MKQHGDIKTQHAVKRHSDQLMACVLWHHLDGTCPETAAKPPRRSKIGLKHEKWWYVMRGLIPDQMTDSGRYRGGTSWYGIETWLGGDM